MWEFVFLPLEWILNLKASLHSLQHLVVLVLRSLKNAQFRTSVLTCSGHVQIRYTEKQDWVTFIKIQKSCDKFSVRLSVSVTQSVSVLVNKHFIKKHYVIPE